MRSWVCHQCIFLFVKLSTTDDVYIFFVDIMVGIKVTDACIKQSRGDSCNNGKSSLRIGKYLSIYIFVLSNKPEHIFVLCFFTLEWYLMDSADNCVVHMLIILIGVITVLSFIFPIRRETRKG